jgi:uncharacterized membrane protein (Fun14 family)
MPVPVVSGIALQKAIKRNMTPSRRILANVSNNIRQSSGKSSKGVRDPFEISIAGVGKTAVAGCLLGYFMKHLLRVTIILGGSTLIVNKILQDEGYVTVNAEKLKRDFAYYHLHVRTGFNGRLNKSDVNRLYERCRLWFNLANGSAFATGILLGWLS